jgi:hypothetical protein
MDCTVVQHFIATNDPTAAVLTLAHSRKVLITAKTVEELDAIRGILTTHALWLLGSQSETDRMRSLQIFEESAEAALLFSLDMAAGWQTQTCSTLVALSYHAESPETAISLGSLIAARPAATIYINCHPPKRDEGCLTLVHGLLKECADCDRPLHKIQMPETCTTKSVN